MNSLTFLGRDIVNKNFRHDIRHFNHIVHTDQGPIRRRNPHTIHTNQAPIRRHKATKGVEGFFQKHGRHLVVGGIGGGLSVGLGVSDSFARSALFFGAMDFAVKHFVQGDPIV